MDCSRISRLISGSTSLPLTNRRERIILYDFDVKCNFFSQKEIIPRIPPKNTSPSWVTNRAFSLTAVNGNPFSVP